MEDSTPKLSNWDFVAVGCYFAAVIAAGLYAMCRSNRSTVSGYFLAGRFMTWMPVGASLFASNIGSEHFIGLAGSGAAAGIAVGAFELNACFLLQLLGWVFLPVYIASGVCTLPEYMKKRFGGKRIRIYLATLSLALYIFTKISVNLYSGALFIQQALQWNLYVSVLLLLIATAITTVTGGLAAVIYTDTLQAFVMVAGALILAVLGFMRIGGYSELYHRYMEAIPNTTLSNVNASCGYPRADSWYMLRDPVGSDMPWVGFLLGQTPASVWYWCTDQMMVQRTLAAKSLSHAQGGTLFAGYLKILPVFLLVIPGMMSRVLFTDEVACADPDICFKVCQNRLGCSNIAYPKLVLEIMPIGLKGIMLSVMLAALMSDLTSIFNSASTLFTIDIYGYIRKKAKNRELMIVGRAFVCVMVAIGIGWIPIIQGMQGAQLYIYIQSISAYLAPPIASVYLMAVLWKRANEQGAFWGLMIGLFIGATRMLMDFAYPEPACGSENDNRPVLVKYVHYMYFAMILFIITGLSVVIISLFTKKPKPDQIIRTTYWTRFDDRLRYDEKLECQQTNDSYRLKDMKNGIYYEREVMVFPDTEIPNGNGHAGDEVHLGNGCLTEAQANGDVANKRVENQVTTLQELPPRKSMLRRGAEWFCGMQSTIEAPLSVQEFTDQIHKITSLKQNPTARLCLYIALAVLFVLDIFLYIFFCTGSDFGLLRGRHHDIFINNQSVYTWLNSNLTMPFV